MLRCLQEIASVKAPKLYDSRNLILRLLQRSKTHYNKQRAHIAIGIRLGYFEQISYGLVLSKVFRYFYA